MTKTLPVTEARKNLTTLVDRAKRLLDESWKETNEILADKELMKAIRAGEEDIKKGRYITFEQLKKELKLNV